MDGSPSRTFFRRSGLCAALAVVLLCGAPAEAQLFKDNDAREGVEQLRQRLNQIESSLQVRQMGLGEQIQTIREDIARLDALVDENRVGDDQTRQRLETARIEAHESVVQLSHDNDKRFKVVDENQAQLVKGIEDVQRNLRALSDSVRAMSDFEKAQEERLAKAQLQLQDQIRVVVEEVSQENARIRGEISQVRGDLAGFVDAVNTLDGRTRGLATRLDDLQNRLESLRKQPSQVPEGQHVVQKGETLSIISQQYGVTVQSIMDANGISNPNLIRVGQSLVIPGP